MYPKVKKVLENIINCFKTGDVPKAIAYSMYPIPNIPASKWSLCNKTLMFFSGTQDARGFNQWHGAGRHVKKGAKAFHILAPKFVKKDNGDGEREALLTGFLIVPVFRYEDTEGEALDYKKVELPDLPASRP